MFGFLSEKISSVFSKITGKGVLNENTIQKAFEEIETAFLDADVPYAVVQDFITQIKEESLGQKIVGSLNAHQQFVKIVHEKLKTFLGGQTITFSFQIPSTIMVMGLQGSGKTTSIAKMAHYVIDQAQKKGKKRKILMASVDFYRPAAVDQLEILSKQVGCNFYRSSETGPVRAARDIQEYAKRERYELLFLDTAGRLHVDTTMLEELKSIDVFLKPRYKFLVIDAMTGQESLNVAQSFDQGVGFQSAILTKMDSETRAGAAFAFRYVQKKPILFVGIGEKIADLQLFYPDRMAGRILGMGDMLSLIEKADVALAQEEQDAMQQTMMSGRMSLQDFADQISMVNKLGSLSSLSKYIPGMAGKMPSQEVMDQGEKELKKFKAALSSMTPKERLYPRVLDASRMQRVAQGSGLQVADIKSLLQRFEQSQQYAKLFKRFFKGNSRFQ